MHTEEDVVGCEAAASEGRPSAPSKMQGPFEIVLTMHKEKVRARSACSIRRNIQAENVVRSSRERRIQRSAKMRRDVWGGE